MNKIGFKTAYMEREERMPVVFNTKKDEQVLSEAEQAELMLKLRIRKKAIDLLDEYLNSCLLIDYVKGQLQDLKKLYEISGKV